jgi:regulatory protein YycI of two-component signal transduction system YycFG
MIILVFLVLNFGFGWSYNDKNENQNRIDELLNTTNTPLTNSTIDIEDEVNQTIEVKIELPQKIQNNTPSNSTDLPSQNTTQVSSETLSEHQDFEVIDV